MQKMETDKANRKLTQNCPKSHGEGDVRDNTKRQENINLDQRKDWNKRHFTGDQTTEMEVGRTCSQDERQQIDEKTNCLASYNDERSKKRLDTRWRDAIEKFAEIAWQRLAQDGQLWKEMGKVSVQQWTYNG